MTPKPSRAETAQRLTALAKARPKLLRALFPREGDYADAVQASGARARPQRNPGDAASALLKHMIHVPVNPSREENSFILRRSYVFTDAAAAQDARHMVANRSSEAANAFLERLVGIAKAERDRSLPHERPIGGGSRRVVQNGDRVVTLIGERGAGKTYFLNHVFTEHAQSLDDRKVVWVRVNLISDRRFDSDLQGWIHAQIAKILLRYHDPRSGYRTRESASTHPFCDLIEAWIEGLPAGERGRRADAWTMMRMKFVETGSDHDISPENTDSIIALQLFRLARLAGWSFIVVLDGFDRLDHDPKNTGRFKTISDQLQALMSGNAAFGAAFLVVTRSETFAWLSAHPTWVRMEPACYEVAPSALFDIIDRRLDVISQWHAEQQLQTGRQSVPELARDFRNYLNTTDAADQLEELDRTLSDNIRAKLQMVELIFKEFYQDAFHQGYRVVEYLVKAGYSYPPLLYDHVWEDGRVSSIVEEAGSYDSRFLPILHRPPVPRFRERRMFDKYMAGSCLHAFRLLQLATALPHGDVQVGDLLSVLNRWFGYDGAISRALIYDFESYELLRVRRARDTFTDADTDNVVVTHKGRLALELALEDPAYLNLSAMRILLHRSLLKSPGFFEAATLSAGGNYKAQLQEWLRVKLKNAAAMAVLLSAVNEDQQQRFRPGAARAPFGFEAELMRAGFHRGVFEPIRGLPARVAAGLGVITASDSAAQAELETMLDRLEKQLDAFDNG